MSRIFQIITLSRKKYILRKRRSLFLDTPHWSDQDDQVEHTVIGSGGETTHPQHSPLIIDGVVTPMEENSPGIHTYIYESGDSESMLREVTVEHRREVVIK